MQSDTTSSHRQTISVAKAGITTQTVYQYKNNNKDK